jgi:hypothetical protein
MNALTGYGIAVTAVLALAALGLCLRWGPNRFPPFVYVIGVVVAWAVVSAFAVHRRPRTVPYLRVGLWRIRARDARHVHCRTRVSHVIPNLMRCFRRNTKEAPMGP